MEVFWAVPSTVERQGEGSRTQARDASAIAVDVIKVDAIKVDAIKVDAIKVDGSKWTQGQAAVRLCQAAEGDETAGTRWGGGGGTYSVRVSGRGGSGCGGGGCGGGSRRRGSLGSWAIGIFGIGSFGIGRSR
jgi:hypothetical protein